jgi:hypothetical protein
MSRLASRVLEHARDPGARHRIFETDAPARQGSGGLSLASLSSGLAVHFAGSRAQLVSDGAGIIRQVANGALSPHFVSSRR